MTIGYGESTFPSIVELALGGLSLLTRWVTGWRLSAPARCNGWCLFRAVPAGCGGRGGYGAAGAGCGSAATAVERIVRFACHRYLKGARDAGADVAAYGRRPQANDRSGLAMRAVSLEGNTDGRVRWAGACRPPAP